MIRRLADRLAHIRTIQRRLGTRFVLKTILLGGIVKRPRALLNFALFRRRYEQHLIFIIGNGRSGTTWLARSVASLRGFDLYSGVKWHRSFQNGLQNEHPLYRGIRGEFKGKLAVVKAHTYWTEENASELKRCGNYIVVVRDPRDALISAYYYCRKSPWHSDHPAASSMGLHDFISHMLESGRFNSTTLDWIRGWVKNRDADASILVRYEDMISDPAHALGSVFRFLKIAITLDQLSQIVIKQGFEFVTKRKRGQENRLHSIRKASPGEWRTAFNEFNRNKFAEVGEDVIQLLKYEPTLSIPYEPELATTVRERVL